MNKRKQKPAQQLTFGLEIFFRPKIQHKFLANGADYCNGINELCNCGCRIIAIDVKTGGYIVTYHDRETKPSHLQKTTP